MRILIISVSNLKKDPRVHRQIAHLNRNHSVTCIGLVDPEVPGVAFHQIPINPLHIRAYNAALMALHQYNLLSGRNPSLQLLRDEFINREFDLVIANDTNTLSFACAVKGSARLVFDAHEYAPREFEDSWRWRFLHQGYQYFLCRHYIPECDRIITVCDGIADEFEREFGRRPAVITNASDYRELSPTPVNPDRIRLIHHGGVNPQRQLERMVEVMQYLDDRFSLDLMLVVPDGNATYFRSLKRLVGEAKNVRIIPPVAMQEIPSTINQYDIGLYILEPTTFNDRHSLPNKLFEFVQARLAIAIGPSIEMAKVVKQHDLGIISEDFSPEMMANRLMDLTADQIMYYKKQSDRAAFDLSSERNLREIDCLVAELADINPVRLGDGWR